jgi:uncharacterized SAM-binding protein YcdF (DUF218 family)
VKKTGLLALSGRLACLLLLLLLAASSRLSYFYAQPLLTDSMPVKSDVIVLLSHGQTGKDWLSPEGAQRTLGTLWLYRGGYAPAIVSSGSNPSMNWDQAAVQAEWLERAGIPREVITIERRSHRTYESAMEVARLMQEHNWKSLVVVASLLDVPRVRLVFKKQNLTPSFLEVPEFGPPRDLFGFGYLGIFYHASYEYVGLVYYWLRGWI